MYPNGPGLTPLSIGAVTFNTSECPEILPIGAGEQMIAVHTLVGGSRVVQSLGVSPNEVTWSGKLFDQNVSTRVGQLRLYMTSGQQVLLKWGSESYYCKIKSFVPKYHGGYAEYDITVVITKDANGAFTVSTALSIDTQVQALQSQANAANQAILSPAVQAANLTSSEALPGLTPAAISAANLASTYQSALSGLNLAIATAGPIAANITTAGPGIISAALGASSAVTSYIGQIGVSSPAFANANLLLSSINAISANVQRGQSPSTTVVQGLNLFKVSAQQYGDVTQAFNVQTTNNLPSPFVSALQSTNLSLAPF